MSQLYAFGSNGSGQLGLGHLEDVNVPQACIGIPADESIKKVVGGGNHSAALTHSGRLFMAGASQLGSRQQKKWEQQTQGGLQVWMTYHEPFPDQQWKDVACGWAFTLLVNLEGAVFGIGSTSFGELGKVDKQHDVTELFCIAPETLVAIDSVACGWRHCLALDRQGNVYGWGWGKYGTLSCQQEQEQLQKTTISTPRRIETLEPVIEICCGHLHSLFLGISGRVYGCGMNKYGQLQSSLQESMVFSLVTCFDGDVNSDGVPSIPATATKIQRLLAGWHHSALISKNQELIIWGKNDSGQIQQGLQNVTMAVSGSEHMVALLDNNSVVSWGWNEHGNCSTDREKVLKPVVIHLPSPSSRADLLGAGCATSWVVLSSSS